MTKSFLESDEVQSTKKRRHLIGTILTGPLMSLLVGFAFQLTLLRSLSLAVFLGLPIAAGSLFTQWISKRKFGSFGLTALVQALSYSLFMTTVLVLLVALLPKRGAGPKQSLFDFIVHGPGIWVYIILYIWILIVVGLSGISRKLGPGVFFNWMRGYYFQPRTEERIFMFLDMKDSTSLAESLGDLKFSALVRDFFSDLSGPLLETQGEVSHYIGDEAVLTWIPKRGLAEAKCIQCFYRFGRTLESRSSYYLKHYGLVPQFKAGAHIGNVVATEVGDIKSEIVYHGDVLNTTARLQSVCGDFDADFVVSSTLHLRLPESDWFGLTCVGDVMLKGKSQLVTVYRVVLQSVSQS